MAITFPGTLDVFTNPGTATLLTDVSHSGQHSDENDAVEALEAKVGVGAGTPTANLILVGTGNGTATWQISRTGYTSSTATAGGTVTFNCGTANRHLVTFGTGNVTLAVTGDSVGQIFMVETIQDAVGSRTATWWSGIGWTDGAAPTLTTTADKKDAFGFIKLAAGTYNGYTIGQNL